MKAINDIDLTNVQAVYDGPEGKLWELIMGEQIHIGGFASSMDLADRAPIAEVGGDVIGGRAVSDQQAHARSMAEVELKHPNIRNMSEDQIMNLAAGEIKRSQEQSNQVPS